MKNGLLFLPVLLLLTALAGCGDSPAQAPSEARFREVCTAMDAEITGQAGNLSAWSEEGWTVEYRSFPDHRAAKLDFRCYVAAVSLDKIHRRGGVEAAAGLTGRNFLFFAVADDTCIYASGPRQAEQSIRALMFALGFQGE